MQADDFSHADLFRRARRRHERALAKAVDQTLETAAAQGDFALAALGLFAACVPAIPYAPAAAFLGREKQKLTRREGEPRRVALVADGVGGMHGVTHTLDEIRDRGVAGFEVEVIGTDSCVDRRLSAVAEVDIPFYEGLKVGVPSLPAAVEALAEGRYDLVHLCSPGPAGVAAALIARIMELPTVGSYHTELGAYAGLRSGDARLRAGADVALAAFYGGCDVVLSPSTSADDSLRALGVAPENIGRWDRGVDLDPVLARAARPGLPARRGLACSTPGGQSKEKGADLLADAFLAARARDPRLHLCLAGGGPESERLRERLGRATPPSSAGWRERSWPAPTRARTSSSSPAEPTPSARCCSSPRPAACRWWRWPRAVRVGLIEHDKSGLLAAPDADALADAVLRVAGSPVLAQRLAEGGLSSVAERSWAASLEQLAEGYRRGLAEDLAPAVRRAA